MTDISFLGLGLMGAAIARQIQQGGHKLTVWNRSPAKTQPFFDQGATAAKSVLQAVSASPVIVICIENYRQTQALFEHDEIKQHLKDKIIVQLSTGTPDQAAQSETWFSALAARYLDGAVLGGPASLDNDYGQIILSGSASAYRDAEPGLLSMCRKVRYINDNVRAASALDIGWLSRHYGLFLGITHGMRVCESEGIGLDLLAEVIPQGEYARNYVEKTQAGKFNETTGTLSTWASAFDAFTGQATDSGINSDMPDLMQRWFDQALAAGLGEEDITALIKIFR